MELPGPLSNTYAGLKGWQWAALVGTAAGVFVLLRSRAGAGAPTSGLTTGSPAGTAASAGYQPLTTIVLQNGPPSQPITPNPTTKTTKPPAPTPALPKVNAANYAQIMHGTPGASWIKVGSQNAAGHYTGHNVSGGVPVYAYSPGLKEFFQGFSSHSGARDIYIPAKFKAYIQ